MFTLTILTGIVLTARRAKLRLATAGPLHNLITYLSLFILAGTGLPHLFWTDQSVNGVTIYSVAPSSPLYGHVHAGDLITHVDDVFMGHDENMGRGQGGWQRYMSSDNIGDEGKGWCVDRSVYMSEF